MGGMLKKIKILQFSFFHLGVNRFCKDIKGYIKSCNTVLRYCLGGEFIMIRAPSCGKQCYSLVTVTTMKKNQAEEEDEREKKKSSHLKVTENAFDITQDLLPVRPVCLQHLLRCLSQHVKIRL